MNDASKGNERQYRHPVGPLCIGDPGSHYNGWSWTERTQTTPIQKLAVAERRIVKPTACGITGYGAGGDTSGRGYVFMHNEDYGSPLEFYAVGRFVHHALHSRFTDPLRWFRLVRKHYVHGAWFTMLTMDPSDMQRPFSETYPRGLPADGVLWPSVAGELGLSPTVFSTTVAEAARRGLHAGNLFRHGRSVPPAIASAHAAC